MDLLSQRVICALNTPLLPQKNLGFGVPQKNLGFGVPKINLTSRHDGRLSLKFITPTVHGFPFPSPASATPFPAHITPQMSSGFSNNETPDMLFPSFFLFES